MPDHRIVCVTLDHPTDHKHIVSIGTATDPARPVTRWTLDEIRTAMSAGDRFYTYTDGSPAALVESYRCKCGFSTIRSAPDATLANNLDRLRECP